MDEEPKGYIVPCLRTVDPEHLRELLAKDQFFWLDLASPSPDAPPSTRAALPSILIA